MYLVPKYLKKCFEKRGGCPRIPRKVGKSVVPSHILATRFYEWDPRGVPSRVLGAYKGHRLLLL